jgi:hypothetical protein
MKIYGEKASKVDSTFSFNSLYSERKTTKNDRKNITKPCALESICFSEELRDSYNISTTVNRSAYLILLNAGWTLSNFRNE